MEYYEKVLDEHIKLMNDDYKYKNHKNLVDSAIEINKISRPNRGNRCSSAVTTALEHYTVHIDAGRRIGKSQYIANKATNKDLIIAHNILCAKNLHPNAIYPNEENIKRKLIGVRNIDYVFINEPRLVFEVMPKEELYWNILYCLCEMPTFVQLGR